MIQNIIMLHLALVAGRGGGGAWGCPVYPGLIRHIKVDMIGKWSSNAGVGKEGCMKGIEGMMITIMGVPHIAMIEPIILSGLITGLITSRET